MKTIAFAVIVVLMLAPGVLAEEAFNPNTGEWEEGSGADEVVQDPYGNRPLYKDPDIETSYDPYQDRQDLQQPRDDTWSDDPTPEDQWDKPQAEDDLPDSDGDDDEWNQPPAEEGYSDGGDQWGQEQPQEESWSYSPGTRERRGPPPPLRVPSNRR